MPTPADTSWFAHDRLGLFIHWGLYSAAARHEWVMFRERITPQEYQRLYLPRFDPDLHDPRKWAAAGADAGMKYFVITTKHHEGFCLWDSKLTDFKAPNTPAKRDVLRPLVEAFRERGLRTGFYHSLIDWHHPDFTVDSMHPLRGEADRAQLNHGKDFRRYVEFLHGQTRELLTGYGPVDILWYDFSYPAGPGRPAADELGLPWDGKGRDQWQSDKLVKLVRQLQPNILLNDRLDLSSDASAWDLKTPEQFQPRDWFTVNGRRVTWEACQTFSGSWGYARDEMTWRSVEQLVATLIDCVSKGGNLLLNVGPTGRGEFDARALERLAGIGRWMHHHSRSIYGCTEAPSEFACPADARLTFNPAAQRLYVHLLGWPYKHLHLDGAAYRQRVEYAQLLHDASQVLPHGADGASEHGNLATNFDASKTLTLTLPPVKPDVAVPVIELFLKK